MEIKVVDPKLGASSLTYTPVELSRITKAEAGVNLNYRDLNQVAMSQLRLFSMFAWVERGKQALKLLFFLADERRPFLVDGFKVQYADFPLPRADTVMPQLRSFGFYLREGNPNVGIDRWTFDFLAGKPPRVLEKEIVVLATALGEVLHLVDTPAPTP